MGVCPSRAELEEFLTDRLPADSDTRVSINSVLHGLSAGPGELDGCYVR